MERVSLVGTLLLLLVYLFSVFKVYYKQSLIEQRAITAIDCAYLFLWIATPSTVSFWKLSLEELVLSSRSFAFAFDDVIL